MNAEQQIDEYIASLGDWRGELMAQLRAAIREADPGITEEWKWSTPVFVRRGQVCALGVFKDHVKVNFFKGASLPDPQGLFNAGLDAKTSRAIDFGGKAKPNRRALKDLVRAAVAYNVDK